MSSLFNGTPPSTIRDALRAVNSHMVAFPVFDQRTSSVQLANENARTSSKLIPRKGATDVWLDEFSDLLVARKLRQVSTETDPLAILDLQTQMPGAHQDVIESVHRAAVDEWWYEATQLYHLVRNCVDLTGIYEKKDLAMIKSDYCQGDLRHGPKFLHWATSFTNMSSVKEQSKLIDKVQSSKLNAACTFNFRAIWATLH